MFRKIKKLILSHQVDTIVILLSLIICILGTIVIAWWIIPIIVLIDAIYLYWDRIFTFIKKIFKFKVKIKEEVKEEIEIIPYETIEEHIDDNFITETIIKEEGSSNKMFKKKVKKEKKIKKVKNKSKKKNILKIILLIILIGIIACFLACGAFWIYIVNNAPKFSEDNLYKKESSILYDRNGEVFTKLGTEKREKITYDELPEVLINAIVATEDSRFFQHNGFDLPRFIKASAKQIAKKLLGVGGAAGGASTLTMQISKNAFTSTESEGIEGIIRKFTDIYVAVNEIEKNYTKEQILEFYVNSYCLGGSIYGVEQASLSYFGKNAKDLNLSEAAIIAGLFQAPNTYSPVKNPENSAYRRSIVLSLMVRHGYITKEEADAANAIPISDLVVNSSAGTGDEYQGFIDTVVSEIKKDTGYNPYSTPMQIYTTLDRNKQDIVNNAMTGKTYTWENDVVNAGVSVLDTKTGEIVAIATGRDTSGIGLLNHATFENQTKRQIGSTAKPLYDYGPAIEYNNWSPYNYIGDEPYQYSSENEITNWDGLYQSIITARQALAGSRNVPALKVFQQVKNKNILEFVTNLGLSPEISGGSIHEAHAIGGYNGESPTSVSAAYAAFGNGGTYNEPHSYTRLVYRDTGKEVKKEFTSRTAMKDSTSFIIFDMLVSTSQEAMRGYRNINGWSYGAKTGTSNFTKETKEANHLADDAINDLWCTGVTDEYTISVWYGYDKINSQYYSHFGNSNHIILMKTIASSIWTRSSNITKPDSVVSVTVEAANHDEAKLPSKYTPDDQIMTEYFVKGSEPTEVSTRFYQLSNPKNLTGTYANGEVTLKWDEIATPDELNRDLITKYMSKFFTNPAWLGDAVNNRYNYYAVNLGGISYDIYEKTSDGLKLVDTTTENTIKISLTSNSSDVTFVVKTSWGKYDKCDSTGVMKTISVDNSTPIVRVSLIGNESVELVKGTNYVTGITVYSNDVDVTNSSTITYSILDSTNKQVATQLTSINTLDIGTYKIKYTAKYNGISKSIERTLIIK